VTLQDVSEVVSALEASGGVLEPVSITLECGLLGAQDFILFCCSSIQVFPFFSRVPNFTSNRTKIRSAVLQGIVLG
jgi:hypothetical protein